VARKTPVALTTGRRASVQRVVERDHAAPSQYRGPCSLSLFSRDNNAVTRLLKPKTCEKTGVPTANRAAEAATKISANLRFKVDYTRFPAPSRPMNHLVQPGSPARLGSGSAGEQGRDSYRRRGPEQVPPAKCACTTNGDVWGKISRAFHELTARGRPWAG
jgi:hypothetical protein